VFEAGFFFSLVQFQFVRKEKVFFNLLQIKRLLPDSEVILQYMEKTVVHGDTFYRWPVKEDLSQEHVDCILKKLPSPVLVEDKSSTRVQVYSFMM
jgi:hypothetical protein